MKKIFLSAFTIITAIALTGLGTFALFSVQEELPGNTFATGSGSFALDLTLNASEGKPFNVTDAVPGEWTDWEYVDIFNSGDQPFEAYLSFEQTGGDTALYDMINIELATAGGDGECNTADFAENQIYSGLLSAYDPTVVVSDIAYWHLANEDDAEGGPDNIRAGWTERVCQRLQLDSSADETVMDMEVEFSEIVDAVQDND